MTTTAGAHARSISLNLRPRYNEHGEHMLWLASWLIDERGAEGDWFYSGTGGDAGAFEPPAGASGVRIRRWPSNGLEPEYVDVDLPAAGGTISDRGLRFDRPQSHSLLAERRATAAGTSA